MDKRKLEELTVENMKSIFGFALTRLGNVHDAECLVSDILYGILKSADSLRDEERFFGFMWKIAENTYMEYLRRRTRQRSRSAEMPHDIPDGSDFVSDEIIKNEDLTLLRREFSLLSKQYREVTVLYYMEDLSCSEISARLNISTEMVKYYLFRARKILKEGMNMERSYGILSYDPREFEIDFWGTKAGEDNEYREFQRRKIKGNILLAAYYSPVTVQELSMEVGVAVPYLEDEVKPLLDRMYLTKKGGKYLTNIPIFTTDCTKAIEEKVDEAIENAADRFMTVTDKFSDRFGDRFRNDNLARWQKLLLSLHYALIETENDLESRYGSLPADGPYSLVNGGGGCGIVWGREAITAGIPRKKGIRGIYDGCPSQDGRGTVIAMNLYQTLNSQRFTGDMTDPIVCTAVDCFEYLPGEWQENLTQMGYARDGKANFAVWSGEEYDELREILSECSSILTELNRRTYEIAAEVTADLAPAHIRKIAEYVGAFVYRFNSIEKLVDTLYDKKWIAATDDGDKPAICVVKS